MVQFLRLIYHNIWLKALYHIKLFLYWLKVSGKVKKIRKKDKIKVLFIVSEAASWKSELLYQSMLKHPRFMPILGISTSKSPEGAKSTLVSYITKKGYEYVDLDKNSSSIDEINPDIIFYYKPYPSCYSDGIFYDKNKKYLFCGMDYCFRVTKQVVHIEKDYFDYCWQFYVENEEVAERKKEVLGYRAHNCKVTGVPMQDILRLPKECFPDPWEDKSGKKRIIYAPHHSIKGTNGEGIEFATFLEFGEAILELVKKYSDNITVTFKPHPNLYMKLVKLWGQEKTDAYYNEWNSLPNTQIETGEYVGLFKYSDAIIHDSASFIVEYLYMDKPSMYLVAETNNMDDMFKFVQSGFNCYEHGRRVEEIECFINDVIQGLDKMKDIRKNYYNNQLLPANGEKACDNILNAILYD